KTYKKYKKPPEKMKKTIKIAKVLTKNNEFVFFSDFIITILMMHVWKVTIVNKKSHFLFFRLVY
ncbi:hypothetical protein, partial [Salmonella sp. s54395]|uniref:hypothetical protein n=1 Tax=Salmonella sp. s54395 TaxID=3159664 RepID=UPI0039816670